jgi:hypothetical protein
MRAKDLNEKLAALRNCWSKDLREIASAAICTVERRLRGSIAHTAKTEMVGAGADLSFPSGANHVARAILIRAQKRAASHGSLGLVGFARIERGNWTGWIIGRPASLGKLQLVVRAIPVAHPVPDISGHVVQAIYPFGGYVPTGVIPT